MYNFDMKRKSKDIIKEIKDNKGTPSVTVSFRLPTDLATKFKAVCEKQDVSANQVILKLVEDFLSDLK